MLNLNNLKTTNGEDILTEVQEDGTVLLTAEDNFVTVDQGSLERIFENINNRNFDSYGVSLYNIHSGMTLEEIKGYDENIHLYMSYDIDDNDEKVLLDILMAEVVDETILILKAWNAETLEVSTLSILF